MSEQPDKSTVGLKGTVTGLNDNLDFLGKRLHIQTEYVGFPAAHIVTQVFSNGRVLMSQKTECPADIHRNRDLGAIQTLMSVQHCQILREIAVKQDRVLGAGSFRAKA